MSRSWLVPVTALRRNVGQRLHEHREGPLGPLEVAGSRVRADSRVVMDVVLSSISGGIEVIGTVSAPWEAECRRCLAPVQGELAVDVRELYRPAEGGDEDEETYPLGSDHLDLAPLARDALLLELPLAPLCRPGCAGLCPTCGADRNQMSCRCPSAAVDPRWEPLEALRRGGAPA